MREMYKIKVLREEYMPEWKSIDFIYSPFIPRIGDKIGIPWTCVKDMDFFEKGDVNNSESDEVIDVLYNFDDKGQIEDIIIWIKWVN